MSYDVVSTLPLISLLTWPNSTIDADINHLCAQTLPAFFPETGTQPGVYMVYQIRLY